VSAVLFWFPLRFGPLRRRPRRGPKAGPGGATKLKRKAPAYADARKVCIGFAKVFAGGGRRRRSVRLPQLLAQGGQTGPHFGGGGDGHFAAKAAHPPQEGVADADRRGEVEAAIRLFE